MTVCLLSFQTKTSNVSGNVLTSFAYLLKLHLCILNADAFINPATLLDSFQFLACTSSLRFVYFIFCWTFVIYGIYKLHRISLKEKLNALYNFPKLSTYPSILQLLKLIALLIMTCLLSHDL